MRHTDFQLVLLMARHGEDADRTIRYLRHGHVDGAVVVSHHRADDIEKALLSARCPACSSAGPGTGPTSSAMSTPTTGSAAPWRPRHLLERGRRRIGTVAGPADMIAAVDRLAGWRGRPDRRRACRPTPSSTATSPRRAEREATRELLERHPDLDAIFVANDLMAVGALSVLRAAGRVGAR